MAHYDLREYLEKLDKAKEFRRHATAVDTRFEAGAIIQRLAEQGGPAIQFTRVNGGPDGATLVGGTMNRGSRQTWAKVAHTLEMDPLSSYHALLEEVVKRMDSTVKPMQVRNGPCKENVLSGADIDLEKMLAPWIHGDDGGRCISSWGFVVVQEPGSNYLVWDIVPHLVHGPKELAAAIQADSALGKVFARYRASATPMPFAIVLGGSPVVTLAAAFNRRRSAASAADVAGGLQRNPLQLVKCEASELLVPATAEMVIEGVVSPARTASIGSFPGSFGYVTERKATAPLWEVTTITYRNKPILPFATWGVPITEIHLAHSLDCDIQLKQEFAKRGTPATGVYTPPWLAGSAVAIGTKVPFTAFSQSIAGIVRATEATKNIPYVLVFDDDIDVTNPISMFHALVTKCRPGRDTWQIHNTCGAHDAPYLDGEARALGKGAALIFDCTWPLDWDRSIAVPPRVSFDQCYPKDLQEKILAVWSTELGFPKESERPAASV